MSGFVIARESCLRATIRTSSGTSGAVKCGKQKITREERKEKRTRLESVRRSLKTTPSRRCSLLRRAGSCWSGHSRIGHFVDLVDVASELFGRLVNCCARSHALSSYMSMPLLPWMCSGGMLSSLFPWLATCTDLNEVVMPVHATVEKKPALPGIFTCVLHVMLALSELIAS